MRFREEIQKMLRAIRNKFLFPLLSALFLIVSFPRCSISLLAWVAFLPLFFALRHASIPGSFFLSFLTGVVFWIVSISWLAHVTFIGMLGLVLYLAVYFGIFGLVVRLFVLKPHSQQDGLSATNVLLVASFWVILEYARSLYLFPALGYSQSRMLPLFK